MSQPTYRVLLSVEFETILKRLERKKPDLFRELHQQIKKVVRKPMLGKPLGNVLRNYRRIHVGSFVLVYDIAGEVIRLHDFDHHDRIYKKF